MSTIYQIKNKNNKNKNEKINKSRTHALYNVYKILYTSILLTLCCYVYNIPTYINTLYIYITYIRIRICTDEKYCYYCVITQI